MKVILIALFFVIFSTVSYGQKVIKIGSAVIIDCSEMDPKFYSDIKKASTTTATDRSGRTNGAIDISSPESNAKVYKKFEVANIGSINNSWALSFSTCRGLGTGWRLPTQRELILIWILKNKLLANGVGPFPAARHWSATETSTYLSWSFDFADRGWTSRDTLKTDMNTARCVRDHK